MDARPDAARKSHTPFSGPAASAGAADRTLVLTRVLEAPRKLVWKAWTQSEHMARWWGCPMTKTAIVECDFRVGGTLRVTMRLEDGTDHRVRSVYREIKEPEKLVFTWAWEDAAGNLGHETLVTVTFVERNDKTEMTLHHAVFETAELRDLHGQGWTASFDRLVVHLAGGATGRA